MNKTEMENKILSFLYDCWQTGHHESVGILYKQLDKSDTEFLENAADELENKDFIKDFGECLDTKITPKGIMEVKSRDLISPETVQKMKNARYKILQVLSELRISEGMAAELGYDGFCEKYEMDENICSRNFDFLREIDFIKDVSTNSFKITEEGLKRFEILQKRKYFVDKFEEISGLMPKPRGIALQKLFAEVINFAECPTQEGIRHSYEEIDIAIEYDKSYYLVECKWEKKKTDAHIVRELFGKISNRAEVKGILASISGFTDKKGAVDQVTDYANQKYILLFGKEDISQIIYKPESFKSLVNEKLKKLMWKKEVDWK